MSPFLESWNPFRKEGVRVRVEENFDQLLAEERSKYAEHPEMKEGLEPGAMKTQFGCMFFPPKNYYPVEYRDCIKTWVYPTDFLKRSLICFSKT